MGGHRKRVVPRIRFRLVEAKASAGLFYYDHFSSGQN